MRKRLSSITRRSLVGALVGLAFAAAAGVGLAQITTGSTVSTAATSTTESQTTSTQTTGDFEGKSADDQESEQSDFNSESDENGNQTSTNLNTTSTTPLLVTTTTGDNGTGQVKIDVCHKTGNGGQHTINIATPAWPAHQAHGDTQGACLAPAATNLNTTTTQTTTTTGTTGHGQKPKKDHRGPQHLRNREPCSRGALVVFGAVRCAGDPRADRSAFGRGVRALRAHGQPTVHAPTEDDRLRSRLVACTGPVPL